VAGVDQQHGGTGEGEKQAFDHVGLPKSMACPRVPWVRHAVYWRYDFIPIRSSIPGKPGLG